MSDELKYKGYLLRVATLAEDDGITYYESTCPEFSPTYVFKGTNVDNLFNKFKKEVDSRITYKDKILHTYYSYLRALSFDSVTFSASRTAQELKSIHELFGDLLDLSEADIRREYFESTSKKE